MLRKQPDGGLLDELVFGVGVRAHAIKYPSNTQALGFVAVEIDGEFMGRIPAKTHAQ
jgi:hypothetical protein